MKKLSTFYFSLLLGLIPSLIGLFSFINNIIYATGTKKHMLSPLLRLDSTNISPFDVAWRSIQSPIIHNIFYAILCLSELSMSMLAWFGIFYLIKTYRQLQTPDPFYLKLACVFGIIIWGLGFFVFGGDFLLAWRHTNHLAGLQADALRYATLMFITFVTLDILSKTTLNQKSP